MLNLKNFNGEIFENHNLAPYVAYGVGGPADYFVKPSCDEDIRVVADVCAQQKLPLTMLGSGTNVLVRDKGIRGVVLYLGAGLPGSPEIISERNGEVLVEVAAHFPKANFLEWAYNNKLTGLEFSAGIPGTMGGAVYMNAGTKWGSYSDLITDVKFYSFDKNFYSKTNKEIGFQYRGHGEGLLSPGTIVVSVQLTLYRAASSHPKAKTLEASRDLMDEILSYRGRAQPLERPSCGSVFKNPPPLADGTPTKGAGRLIEAANLKGLSVGRAQVSLKHANFILNLGGATAHDIETLILKIQQKVKEHSGVHLEREVLFFGE